jgi:DNA-binding GntR family transcriptional regulator
VKESALSENRVSYGRKRIASRMSEELAAAGRNGNQDSRALLKQSLATRLRDEILQGRIAPGQKIIEARLARHFGVAQLSIREALNILAAEGFVTKRHGRSARVLSLTESDIIHIYQVRGALEGLAARIIAERKLPLQDIESAMSAIQVAVASNDPLKVIDSVQRFHLSILEKTENPLLLDTGKRLIVPLLAFTRMRVQAKNLDASPWVPEVSNHQRILDALRMGDPHLAEQTVVHITGCLFLKAALAVWTH